MDRNGHGTIYDIKYASKSKSTIDGHKLIAEVRCQCVSKIKGWRWVCEREQKETFFKRRNGWAEIKVNRYFNIDSHKMDKRKK